MAAYYTVVIPYASHGATQWHPTTSKGPFRTLTRGAFKTRSEASAWATSHLGATRWSIRRLDDGTRRGETTGRAGGRTPAHLTNREGLTFKEWIAASGRRASVSNASKHGANKELVAAWRAGEDPTEYHPSLERARAGRAGGRTSGRVTVRKASRGVVNGRRLVMYVVEVDGIPWTGSVKSASYLNRDDAMHVASQIRAAARAHRKPGRSEGSTTIHVRFKGFDIKPGDRIKFIDRFGKMQSGRVVMRSSHPGAWVLNMGGRHGTPAVVAEEDIYSHHPQKKRA